MTKSPLRIIAAVLSICLIAGLFAGCGSGSVGSAVGVSAQAASYKESSTNNKTGTEDKVGETLSPAPELLPVKTYDDVYEAIASAAGSSETGMTRDGGFAVDSAAGQGGASVTTTAPATAPAATVTADAGKAAETASAGSAGYSGTNVQVYGVDEGDIVKTDGKYIYMLRNNRELTILKAEGAGTTVVSDTVVVKDSLYSETSSYSECAFDMYLNGGSIVLLKSVYDWKMPKDGYTYAYAGGEKVYADIYDVTDPENPRLAASYGQDGTYASSRLMDGILYFISTKYVYETVVDDPGTYVPYTYAKGVATIMPVDRIIIPGHVSSTSWTVISSIDIAQAGTVSSLSVLGNASTVYMNTENLYVASSVWDTEESDPYTKDQYTVRDCRSYSAVDIMRFALDGGAVTFAASARVPGYLVSQFAMDEYNGNLRVVTTTSESRYHTYTDEKYGWTNYIYDEYPTTSGLYVLSSDMALVGSVTGLGEDEQVYSVRFSGDIGYFVTFRQTDPLFAVDLSDPANPTVLSALKIPGFSEYLHPYGDGLLLGLGMSADEETGRTQALKLSMFDVSDPADVSEISAFDLKATWSPALYNHHAVLIDTDENIIGFGTDTAYEIYAYKDGSFELLRSVDIGGWTGDARGLYIGSEVYVCTPVSVTVLSLDGFSTLKSITLPNG